jgi:serine/threonine-protein kinase
MIAAATKPVRPILSVAPSVEAKVAAIVDRAVAYDKKDRWPNAIAMRDALREVGGYEQAATPSAERIIVTFGKRATETLLHDETPITVGADVRDALELARSSTPPISSPNSRGARDSASRATGAESVRPSLLVPRPTTTVGTSAVAASNAPDASRPAPRVSQPVRKAAIAGSAVVLSALLLFLVRGSHGPGAVPTASPPITNAQVVGSAAGGPAPPATTSGAGAAAGATDPIPGTIHGVIQVGALPRVGENADNDDAGARRSSTPTNARPTMGYAPPTSRPVAPPNGPRSSQPGKPATDPFASQ